MMATFLRRILFVFSVFWIRSTFCANVAENLLGECLTNLIQTTCPNGKYIEIDPTRNQCAKCRGGLGYASTGCGFKTEEERCAPGLYCEPNTRTCKLDKTKCSYTYHLPPKITTRPTCEADGTFAAKQCKGDMLTGRCFCYSEQGERIFGWDWQMNSEDMTCACSRHRIRLEAADKRTTIHCKQNGNFEELQCDNEICWCVDPKTGQQMNGTRAVQENLMSTLPCYNKEKTGNVYLRQCESQSHAMHQMKTSLTKRGFLNVSFTESDCGFDGNYGVTSIQPGNVIACTWFDGSIFDRYRVELIPNAPPMNCYCALDGRRLNAIGLQMPMTCDARGNYAVWQRVNNNNRQSFCVDRGGFAVTGFVDIQRESDCDQYLYYMMDRVPF